eukprot:7666692-Pyramimonas_sp.AAC.1
MTPLWVGRVKTKDRPSVGLAWLGVSQHGVPPWCSVGVRGQWLGVSRRGVPRWCPVGVPTSIPTSTIIAVVLS